MHTKEVSRSRTVSHAHSDDVIVNIRKDTESLTTSKISSDAVTPRSADTTGSADRFSLSPLLHRSARFPTIDTPPSLESLRPISLSHGASWSNFEAFMDVLLGMGYTYAESDLALTYCKGRSVEEAIDFLAARPDTSSRHAFVPFPVLKRSDPQNSTEVCAICGLEEPFHLTEVDDSPKLQNQFDDSGPSRMDLIESMEISDDPILAQRQRRLQFQMRVARRRDVLRRVKLNESPKDEKTDDLPQEELLHCPICFDFKPEIASNPVVALFLIV
eukprot:95800_1